MAEICPERREPSVTGGKFGGADPAAVASGANVRSKMSDKKRLFRPRLEGYDGRSTWARRFRDLFYGYVDHLGGFDELSDHQVEQCRDLATIRVGLDRRQEVMIVDPENFELGGYAAAAGVYASIATKLGLDGPRKTGRLSDHL